MRDLGEQAVGSRSTPGVPATQAPAPGINSGRSRLIGQRGPPLGQVRGENVGGIPVHQQRARPAAALAVRPPGQHLGDRLQPQRAVRIAACPAMGRAAPALPLRVRAIAANEATGEDQAAIRGCLARLRCWPPEEHRDTRFPAPWAGITVRHAKLHRYIISVSGFSGHRPQQVARGAQIRRILAASRRPAWITERGQVAIVPW